MKKVKRKCHWINEMLKLKYYKDHVTEYWICVSCKQEGIEKETYNYAV